MPKFPQGIELKEPAIFLCDSNNDDENLFYNKTLLRMMKFSRAISRVRLFSLLRDQRFEDHLCPRPQGR